MTAPSSPAATRRSPPADGCRTWRPDGDFRRHLTQVHVEQPGDVLHRTADLHAAARHVHRLHRQPGALDDGPDGLDVGRVGTETVAEVGAGEVLRRGDDVRGRSPGDAGRASLRRSSRPQGDGVAGTRGGGAGLPASGRSRSTVLRRGSVPSCAALCHGLRHARDVARGFLGGTTRKTRESSRQRDGSGPGSPSRGGSARASGAHACVPRVRATPRASARTTTRAPSTTPVRIRTPASRARARTRERSARGRRPAGARGGRPVPRRRRARTGRAFQVVSRRRFRDHLPSVPPVPPTADLTARAGTPPPRPSPPRSPRDHLEQERGAHPGGERVEDLADAVGGNRGSAAPAVTSTRWFAQGGGEGGQVAGGQQPGYEPRGGCADAVAHEGGDRRGTAS